MRLIERDVHEAVRSALMPELVIVAARERCARDHTEQIPVVKPHDLRERRVDQPGERHAQGSRDGVVRIADIEFLHPLVLAYGHLENAERVRTVVEAGELRVEIERLGGGFLRKGF